MSDTIVPTTIAPTLEPTNPPIFGRIIPWGIQLLYMFLLYFAFAVALFLLFLFGRYGAIKAHKKSLEQKNERRYSEKDSLVNSLFVEGKQDKDDVEIGEKKEEKEEEEEKEENSKDWIDLTRPLPSFSSDEESLLGFIPSLIKIDEESIKAIAGIDAYVYLKIQKYLIALFFVISLFGCIVLIPVYATSGENLVDFSRITAINIKKGDGRLWAVFISTIVNSGLVYVLLYYIWRLYVANIKVQSAALELRSFTVMVRNFPEKVTDENLVKEYFNTMYEDVIEKVVINLDCSGLNSYQSKANDLIHRLHHLKALRKLTAKGQKANCHFRRKDVTKLDEQITDTENEMRELREKIKQWNKKEKLNTGICFITFKSLQFCQRLIKAGKTKNKGFFNFEENLSKQNSEVSKTDEENSISFSSFSSFPSLNKSNSYNDLQFVDKKNERLNYLRETLGTNNWCVEQAPDPSDVVHDNMGRNFWLTVGKTLLINAVIIVILFFFTTPISIMGSISNIVTNYDILDEISKSIAQVFKFLGGSTIVYGYIASLMMMICTMVVPRLMTFFTYYQGHETISLRERSTMRKIYVYLLLALVVMPSIFITSLDALWKISLMKGNYEEVLKKIGGIFPNAMFFINYLMAVTLIGNFAEFLYLPNSLVAFFMFQVSITTEEKERAKNYLRSPYMYGFQYAFFSTLFAMCIIYSSVVPIIMIFGLFAMLNKYFVDKHHLVYLNQKTVSDLHIVKSVVKFVLTGLIMYQFVMIVYFFFLKNSTTFAVLIGIMMGCSGIFTILVMFDKFLISPGVQYILSDQILINEEIIKGQSYRNPILKDKAFREFLSEYRSLANVKPEDERFSKIFQSVPVDKDHKDKTTPKKKNRHQRNLSNKIDI